MRARSLLQFSVLLTLALATFLSGVTQAFAATSTRLRTGSGSGVVVTSESMFRDSERQIIELKGNVQIVYDQQFMSCDHAIINLANQTILAEGNLVISSAQAYVEGDSANLSYRDNTGTIINGFVKSGPVIFEGAVVKKTGPQSYDAEKASFTACTTCPTAWTFSGSRIQAEIGGYAYIKHAWLKIADFKTIWLPYLIVPLKSERQTGLLVPTIEFAGSGGPALGMNFFWAISRSQDATFSGKYYTKRGLKGLVNYRYVLSPTSDGELNFGLIRDNVFGDQRYSDPQFGDQSFKGHENRHFINYQHGYELPDGFNQKMKINYVSDLQYVRDFPIEIVGRGDPALESRFTLSRNTERTHASLDSSYYINQLQSNPIASNRDTVQRWPELRYSLAERALADSGTFANVLFNLNFDYVNFARDGLAWDDVVVDPVTGLRTSDPSRTNTTGSATGNGTPGVFDPGVDVIRTGQRLDFQPELSLPFRVAKVLDVLPSIQFRHTQYELNVNPPTGSGYEASPYRQYVRARISTRMRFSQIYGDRTPEAQEPRPSVTNWYDAESRGVEDAPAPKPIAQRPSLFRHEFEPELVISALPGGVNQTKNSAFLGEDVSVPAFLDYQPISNSEFQTGRLQFDYEDRLRLRNTGSIVLNNRLVRKSWLADGSPIYKQVGSLRVSNTYDLEQERINSPEKFPFSDVNALLDVRLDNFETNTLLRYFPYHNKTNTSSRVRVMDDTGRFLEMNFIQTFLITQKREEAYPGRDETIGFSAGVQQKYFNFAGAIDFRPLGWWTPEFRTKSWSAIVNLKPPGNCWGIIVTFRKDIGGETMTNVNFDYNFGGETVSSVASASATSPAALPNSGTTATQRN